MRELAIAYQAAVWPFFGFCFVQTAACSERGAEATVRRYRSSGMSPRPMCSSIAGWMAPRSRSLRTCRSGTAKAVAIASSVQLFEARSSMDRQRSTGDIGARTTFSATARMSSSGSAGLTRIAISHRPAPVPARRADRAREMARSQAASRIPAPGLIAGDRLQDADTFRGGGAPHARAKAHIAHPAPGEPLLSRHDFEWYSAWGPNADRHKKP